MGLAGTTTFSSILHIKMSKKTTEPPIGHLSIKREFTEKTHSFVNFTNTFLKIGFLQNGLIDLSTKILCEMHTLYQIAFFVGTKICRIELLFALEHYNFCMIFISVSYRGAAVLKVIRYVSDRSSGRFNC